MIQRTAQREGSSPLFLERSIWSAFSSACIRHLAAPREPLSWKHYARETAADGHNDSDEDSGEFNRSRRTRLQIVIFAFRQSVHVQPLVIVDVVDQRLRGYRIDRTDQSCAEYLDALQIGADLIQIAPDFAVLSAVTCIQHTDNFPLAATERDLFSDARVGKKIAFGRGSSEEHTSELQSLTNIVCRPL